MRLVACAAVGLVASVPIYVGLAKSGLIRSPFFPKIEGELALAEGDRPGLRVLFVGNSFTYSNAMPTLVQRLAAADAGAPPMFTVAYTAPAWTLRKASRDDGLENLLKDVHWDVVVLQDQSQLLSLPPEWQRREVYPFARVLRREIAFAGGRTVLFMTWAYRDGDEGNFPGDSFDAMQERLARGYAKLGAQLNTPVAPVGLAWAEALRQEPGLDLWASDGKHPNALGSYLAACVFYRLLSGRDPSGSMFTGEVPPARARFFQEIANEVVRANGADLESR
jgi:hypothetical protein